MIYIVILFALNTFIDSLLGRGLYATGSKKSEIMKQTQPKFLQFRETCTDNYNMNHPEFATQWKSNEIGNWNHLNYSSNQLCNCEPNTEILCNRILCNTVPYNTYIKWGIMWAIPVGSKYFGLHVRCLLSHVQLFETPWMHGSFVHGIFQARILEWVAISFSRGSSWPGIELRSAALQADSLPLHHLGSPMNCIHQSLKTVYIIPPVFIMLCMWYIN